MGRTQAFPLQWPEGWPRTPAHKRDDGDRFRRGDWKGSWKALCRANGGGTVELNAAFEAAKKARNP